MNQDIRFCTTTDGVRIAYATVGQGPPLVKTSNWLTHLEFDWESPVWRHLMEALAENHTLIRYDGRGTGLSDRNVDDVSLDGWVRDMEAVVGAAKLSSFALLGISQGGPTAIQYAVRHPEQVSKLIIYGSFARVSAPPELQSALLASILAGWGLDNPLFRQTFTSMFIPEAQPKHTRWFNELQRISASPATAASILKEAFGIDIRPVLPQVQVPTLVFHRRGDAAVPFSDGQVLGNLIPGARFVPLGGENHYMLEGEPEVETFLDVLEEFLGQTRARKERPSPTVTVLFTDLVGHTEMMSRLGDERGRAVLREHESITRDVLRQHGGTEVKTMGDGFMASFGSATKAVGCAIALQQAFAEREGEPLSVRVGLNAGEPIEEDGDLFGATVILASRIAAKADGGEILVADTVRGLCSGKGFLFADRGEFVAKGFEDPVRVYEVNWRK